MMHPHSPSPQQLVVPGIGFPQNFSVAPHVLDPRSFRDWLRPTWFAEDRKTDDQNDCIGWRL
jgi:hypothetical protein